MEDYMKYYSTDDEILLRGNGDFNDEQYEQVLRADDENHMIMTMKENVDHIEEIQQFCKDRNILFTARMPERLGTAKETWETQIAGSSDAEDLIKQVASEYYLGGEVFRTDHGSWNHLSIWKALFPAILILHHQIFWR